jgi:hypothetical protein
MFHSKPKQVATGGLSCSASPSICQGNGIGHFAPLRFGWPMWLLRSHVRFQLEKNCQVVDRTSLPDL